MRKEYGISRSGNLIARFPLQTETFATVDRRVYEFVVHKLMRALREQVQIPLYGIQENRLIGYVFTGFDTAIWATLTDATYFSLYRLLNDVLLVVRIITILPENVAFDDYISGAYAPSTQDVRIDHFKWVSSQQRKEIETWGQTMVG